jgi:hypothetical protein
MRQLSAELQNKKSRLLSRGKELCCTLGVMLVKQATQQGKPFKATSRADNGLSTPFCSGQRSLELRFACLAVQSISRYDYRLRKAAKHCFCAAL